ncbi:MAG TPA: hypothetical protein VIU34_25550, partial [Steroidobacter sp.]
MSSPRAANYTVETLRRIDSPDELATRWRQLPQIAQEFTQSVDWTLVAAERLYGADALRLIQARRDGEIVALAPLGVTRGGGVERLEILGATTLFEPCGFGYRDDDALVELCRAVLGLGRPLVLQRIEADGALLKTFKSMARGRGQLLEFKASGSPFVPI